jgi:steroid delta-isomerase-like uncharacterized protein
MSVQIIEAYYRSFNARDYVGMLALLDDDVVHEINEGAREVGKGLFSAFLERMDRGYREQITELVVMSEPGAVRFAAEFIVIGEYLKTAPGMPEAHGQSYELAAGAFFELDDGIIQRVTSYYNLRDWLQQVGG